MDYKVYIEPDIFHEPMQNASAPPLSQSLRAEQLPPDADADGFTPAESDLLQDVDTYGPKLQVSPGWHLNSDYTGFLDVRDKALGAGIRIAHIDTGYTPDHESTPARILIEVAIDFWEGGKSGAIDPGTQFLDTMQPGHGTATLALLAGKQLKLKWGTEKFDGYFGGAPEADIIPIRIGPTVYHVYSSAMALGLLWALKPGGNSALQADVVSLSHGGLPTRVWADAINALYEAGTIVVASSGDWFHKWFGNVPTHYTVYPAAFNRTITAVGITFNGHGYQTSKKDVMQGSFGPADVMEKAAAAFTPNVAWMDYQIHNGGSKSAFSMSGGGTSSSTPQIAAACALWLEAYKDKFEKNWKRVEACRLALFDSCNPPRSPDDMLHLGHGSLSVPNMLSQNTLDKVIADFQQDRVSKMPEDDIDFPLWRLLAGEDPPGSEVAARMYETEVAQIVRTSLNPALRQAEAFSHHKMQFDPAYIATTIDALLNEPISQALRSALLELKRRS